MLLQLYLEWKARRTEAEKTVSFLFLKESWLASRTLWHTSLTPAEAGRSPSTQWIPGQPGLCKETLSQKTTKKFLLLLLLFGAILRWFIICLLLGQTTWQKQRRMEGFVLPHCWDAVGRYSSGVTHSRVWGSWPCSSAVRKLRGMLVFIQSRTPACEMMSSISIVGLSTSDLSGNVLRHSDVSLLDVKELVKLPIKINCHSWLLSWT